MIATALDWNALLIAFIPTIPALVAAYFAGRTHNHVQTPSGQPIGHVAEYAKDTAIANNLLLSKANGPTKPAEHELLKQEGESPPQVPVEVQTAAD